MVQKIGENKNIPQGWENKYQRQHLNIPREIQHIEAIIQTEALKLIHGKQRQRHGDYRRPICG